VTHDTVPAAPELSPRRDLEEAPPEARETVVQPAPLRPLTTAPTEDEWRFSASPYVWFLALDGTAAIEGAEAEIDQSFSDIWDKLNLVFEGRFEAWKGPWGATLDLTYANLESEADVGPIEVDVVTDMWLVGSSLNRNLHEGPLDGEGSARLRVDGAVGLLVTRADTEIDFPSPAADPDTTVSIEDLTTGIRAIVDLDGKNYVKVAALIGGFEILDDSSDFAWAAEAYYGRRIGENKVLYVGYRFLSIDYDDGPLELDLEISGPAVGIRFGF
jgi:hypothetical protein